MNFKTVVYKSVTRVYYAVAKKDIGCIHKGKAIHGLSGFTRAEVEMKISDWCFNEEVSRNKIAIKSGFVPGEVSNHSVYFNRDWLSNQG